jgi:hypothetical protein
MVSSDEVDPADAVSSAEVEVSDTIDPERDFFPGGLLDMVVSSMRGDILRRTLDVIRAYSDSEYTWSDGAFASTLRKDTNSASQSKNTKTYDEIINL